MWQSCFFTLGSVFIIGAFALLKGYGGWRMLLLIGVWHIVRSHPDSHSLSGAAPMCCTDDRVCLPS